MSTLVAIAQKTAFYRHLRQVIPYLTVVLAALVLVAGLWLVQAVSLSPCIVSDVGCVTFSDFEAHDSFCIIDPTCVSPFYNPRAPGVQRWVGGQAWNLGMDQQPPDDYDFFAIPNYVLFMLLAIGLVVAIDHSARSRRIRSLGLTALFVWCGATVISWWWFAPLGLFAVPRHAAALLEAFGTFVFSLSLLGLTARWLRRRAT